MAGYFVRVELRGTPTADNYSALHALMLQNGFAQMAAASNRPLPVPLPHAVYFGYSTQIATSLAALLRDAVQASVWTSAIVLAVEYASWGIAPG
jgi:hypothetical protein